MKSTSFIIAIVNVTAISVVKAEHKLQLINQYEWLRFILVPFEVLATFSVFFALGGVIIGAKELRKAHNIKLSYTGIAVNSVFLLWFAVIFFNNFDAMLGK